MTLTNLESPLLTESLFAKNFIWRLPVAGFRLDRFATPRPLLTSTFLHFILVGLYDVMRLFTLVFPGERLEC